MAREDIKQLYSHLTRTQFNFVPRGAHQLQNVYRIVQREFPALCDGKFLCSENCQSGKDHPEWQHTVRSVLNELSKRGIVSRGVELGEWDFAYPRAAGLRLPQGRNSRPTQKTMNTLQKPKVKPLTVDEKLNDIRKRLGRIERHLRGSYGS
jgi:hypothetical protein